MMPYLHPQEICESGNAGDGTLVWAFAHVPPGALIGADDNICDHAFVEDNRVIAHRVTITGGVRVWDG